MNFHGWPDLFYVDVYLGLCFLQYVLFTLVYAIILFCIDYSTLSFSSSLHSFLYPPYWLGFHSLCPAHYIPFYNTFIILAYPVHLPSDQNHDCSSFRPSPRRCWPHLRSPHRRKENRHSAESSSFCRGAEKGYHRNICFLLH